MRVRIVTIIIALLIVPFTVKAQWEEHFTYGASSYGGICKDGFFVGNRLAFFRYNPEDLTIEKFSKVNYLSSIDITTVKYADGLFFVGYSNGLIDIIDENAAQTYTITDLKMAEGLSQKSINAFYKYGSKLYCAFESGLLEINLLKHETRGYYRISSQLLSAYDVLVNDGKIYVATSNGLMFASVDSSILEDTKQWIALNDNYSPFCRLVENDGVVFAAQGTIGGKCDIYRIDSGLSFTKVRSVSVFRNMDIRNGKAIFASTSSIAVADVAQMSNNTANITKYKFVENGETSSANLSVKAAHICSDGLLVCADQNQGLVILDNVGNAERHLPNSPSNSYAYDLVSSNGVLYVSFGGWSSANNNLNRTAGVHIYVDGVWRSYTTSGRDLINVCADHNRPDSVYVSAWGTGVLKLGQDGFKIRYNEFNSTLEDIFGNNRGYVRCSALSFDKEGNLYVTNAERAVGIRVKLTDGRWIDGLSYVPSNNLHSAKQLLCTSNGNMWLLIPRSDKKGLMVFNTNATLEDNSDDVYRSTYNVTEDDPAFIGRLPLVDQDGEELPSYFYVVAEDKNGVIWFGTSDGIFRCSQNDAILKDVAKVQYFEHVKVPRNDGTNLADYLLGGVMVKSIVVDADNRKWVGTGTDGLYLLSADGMKMLEHFTVDNSPLPDNDIEALTYDETSGVLYIVAGNSGVVSYQTGIKKNNVESDVLSVRIYPNPILPSFVGDVTIEDLPDEADVRISDVQGRLVYSSKTDTGMVNWNLARFGSGARVSSGVYIVWVQTIDGKQKAVGKIVVVK